MVALSISVPLLWASATSLTTSPARSWKPEASDPTHALSCDEPLTCRPVSTALASYAGLTPVTWRSGTSIRGDHPSRKGNKILKRALFLSAFAALKDPVSRAYYDRKIAQHKKHNQALIALARRRCDVLFAMLRDGTFYSAPTPELTTAA